MTDVLWVIWSVEHDGDIHFVICVRVWLKKFNLRNACIMVVKKSREIAKVQFKILENAER